MKERINPPRGFRADTIDLYQIRDRSALDRLERAEVVEQRALARWANAGDLLQAGLAQIARPARAVRTDGEAMRLVAQTLDKIKHGITRRQAKRLAAGHKERFAASVAIRTFGDRDQRNLGTERLEHLTRGVELTLAAVNQDEIGPWQFSFFFFFLFPLPLW